MINAKCPNCKDEREFKYIGRQSGFDLEPGFDLYNCLVCTGTFVNDTLGAKLLPENLVKKTREDDHQEYLRRKTKSTTNQ